MPPNDELMEYRMDAVERAVEKIAEAVERIASSMAQIAQLEVRHAETREGLERAFAEIAKLQEENKALEGRVVIIERDIPSLKEARGWAITAVGIVVGVVIVTLLAQVVHS